MRAIDVMSPSGQIMHYIPQLMYSHVKSCISVVWCLCAHTFFQLLLNVFLFHDMCSDEKRDVFHTFHVCHMYSSYRRHSSFLFFVLLLNMTIYIIQKLSEKLYFGMRMFFFLKLGCAQIWSFTGMQEFYFIFIFIF